MEKVSIIIPVYNAEKFLGKCINSVLTQTYENWEIIIIDDGSTDNSEKIYNEFAKNDNRFKVYYQDNKGVSAARNFGINIAQGKYIIFIDADDWIEKDFIDRMIEVIEKEKADMVQCNFYYVRNDTFEKRKHISPNYSIRENLEELQLDILYREYEEKKNHNSVGAIRSVWGKIFKASILKEIKFNENIDIFEDGIFILYALQMMKKVVLIDEYLYYYRITEVSSNIKFKTDFDKKVLIIFKEMQNFVTKYKKDEKFIKCFYIMIFEMISATLEKDIFNIHNKSNKKEKIIRLKNFIQQNYCKTSLKQINKKDLNKNQKLLIFLLNSKLYSIIYYLYVIKQKIKIRKIIR